MTDGGEGCKGHVPSIAQRLKTSMSLKGHCVSQETRQRLRESQLGNKRYFSDIHRAKLKIKVHNRRIDDEIVTKLRHEHKNGVPDAVLAARYGVSERTIRRRRKEN